MTETSDEELVAIALATGNGTAFGELVRRHQSRVRRWLARLCGDDDRADDLAQDAFIKAHDKLNSFRCQGRFQSWLFRIAYTTFLEEQRRGRRRLELMETVVKPAARLDTSVGERAAHSALSDPLDLEALLGSLSEQQQRILILFYGFGFTHQEVAAIVELPLGSVKSQIHRAKAQLQQESVLAETGS